ncbi:MAG: GntR family transcriptional regulator [Thermomicrobiales bacterium]
MIEHSDLTTKVYQWLKERIMHHAFLPGDKLDIQQLADDLGVSRTPVKDAINRLTAEGLVVLRSRRGTYVATLTPTVLRNLAETRMMIECWAVEHATPTAMQAAVPAMRAVFDRSTQVITGADTANFDYSAYFALDLDLHAILVGLTGNRFLLDTHHAVVARMSAGRIYYPGEDEVLRRSYSAQNEHAAIVHALSACDRDGLLAAVRAHINASMQHTAWLLDRAAQATGGATALVAAGSTRAVPQR